MYNYVISQHKREDKMPDIQKLTKSATPWGWQEKFEKDFKEKYEIFIRGVPEGKEAFFA